MNVQAEAHEDEDKGLVYNHDKVRVLATIITTFNEHMEHTVEEQGQQKALKARKTSSLHTIFIFKKPKQTKQLVVLIFNQVYFSFH